LVELPANIKFSLSFEGVNVNNDDGNVGVVYALHINVCAVNVIFDAFSPNMRSVFEIGSF